MTDGTRLAQHVEKPLNNGDTSPLQDALDPVAAQVRVFDFEVLPTRDEIAQAFNSTDEHALDLMRLRNRQYEVLNKEFVTELAAYLIEQVQELQGDSDNPTIILEAGAGSGKLNYQLSRGIGQLARREVSLLAVDSGIVGITADARVEPLDYREALKDYAPDIVIVSWMPLGEDWTQAMRDTSSVKEYILIGETGEYSCGASWETWGNRYHLNASIGEQLEDATGDEKALLEAKLEEIWAQAPPSERDGFTMHPLVELSSLQTFIHPYLHSKTVAFRRGIQ